jgi:hypothetical protein
VLPKPREKLTRWASRKAATASRWARVATWAEVSACAVVTAAAWLVCTTYTGARCVLTSSCSSSGNGSSEYA